MRITSAAGALALLGLAACSASPEFSNPMETGVGFGDYQRYLAERDSVRRASATPYSVPPEPTRGAILPPPDMPPAPGTLAAVRDWQAANGLAPDGYVSLALLERMRR